MSADLITSAQRTRVEQEFENRQAENMFRSGVCSCCGHEIEVIHDEGLRREDKYDWGGR